MSRMFTEDELARFFESALARESIRAQSFVVRRSLADEVAVRYAREED